MEISRNMSVNAIMEMMGAEAGRAEAATMVEFLIVGDYTDTDQIGEAEWLELCAYASEGVARNTELASAA